MWHTIYIRLVCMHYPQRTIVLWGGGETGALLALNAGSRVAPKLPTSRKTESRCFDRCSTVKKIRCFGGHEKLPQNTSETCRTTKIGEEASVSSNRRRLVRGFCIRGAAAHTPHGGVERVDTNNVYTLLRHMQLLVCTTIKSHTWIQVTGPRCSFHDVAMAWCEEVTDHTRTRPSPPPEITLFTKRGELVRKIIK